MWDFWREDRPPIRHFFFYINENRYYGAFDLFTRDFITEKKFLDWGGTHIDFGSSEVPVMKIENFDELLRVADNMTTKYARVKTQSQAALVNFKTDKIFIFDGIYWEYYLPEQSFTQRYGNWLLHARHLAFITRNRSCLTLARHLPYELPAIKSFTIIGLPLYINPCWGCDCLWGQNVLQRGYQIRAGEKEHGLLLDYWVKEAEIIENMFRREGLNVDVRLIP